jgi:hypothetical protein
MSDRFTLSRKPGREFPCPPSSEGWRWWEGLVCLGWREARGIAEVLDLGTAKADFSTIDDVVGSDRTLRTVKLSECNPDRGGER